MTDHALAPYIDAELLGDLGVGIIVVSRSGAVRGLNRYARELFEFPDDVTEHEVGAGRFEVVDEHDVPMSYDDLPMSRALRTGASVRGATLGFRRRGSSALRWLRCEAHLVPSDTGEVDVVCTFVEVTAQRSAVDELHDRDRRFRHLAENSADMIFRARVVPDFGFDYLNPAVERVLGYPRDDFYADADLAIRLLHPDDRDDVWAFFADVVAGQPVEDDAIVVRLVRRDGTVTWVQIRAAPISEGGEIIGLEGIARDVTDLKVREADLHFRAMHDALTGIPNRQSFLAALDSALDCTRASGGALAVLYVDLDRFKTVNDGLGHATGDRVLTALASRLAEEVRPSDTVGRIGGDEFAAVLSGVRDIEEAELIAARLLDALGEPMALDEGELVTTASIGVAFTDDCLQTSTELLRRADVAMYEAKDHGRSRVERYEPRGLGGATTPG